MEDLSKQQIILLTLLLSFVTSIATGIMTFSLLSEAPQEVTQTINRVVEKTIERVVPVEIPGKVTETKEVKEITVIVKEEELVIDSVEKNNRSLIRIRSKGVMGDTFHSLGLTLSSKGLVVFPSSGFVQGTEYYGVFSDNATSSPLKILVSDEKYGLVYAQAEATTTNPKKPYVFYPVTFAKTQPKLGQSVIVLGGEENGSVMTGRISSFNFEEVKEKKGEVEVLVKVLSSIKTDIPLNSQMIGGPLLTLSGELLGIKTLAEEGSYVSTSHIGLPAASTTASAQ